MGKETDLPPMGYDISWRECILNHINVLKSKSKIILQMQFTQQERPRLTLGTPYQVIILS